MNCMVWAISDLIQSHSVSKFIGLVDGWALQLRLLIGSIKIYFDWEHIVVYLGQNPTLSFILIITTIYKGSKVQWCTILKRKWLLVKITTSVAARFASWALRTVTHILSWKMINEAVLNTSRACFVESNCDRRDWICGRTGLCTETGR